MTEWDTKYSTSDTELNARLATIRSRTLHSQTLHEVLCMPGDARSVLEIGCGTGQHSVALKIERPGWSVTAVDTSEAAVNEARALAERAGVSVTVLSADSQKLPFPDSTFDIVFGDHVIGHIPDMTLAFRECARVLRPGGWLVVNAGNALRFDGWPLYHALHVKPYLARSIAPWALQSFVRTAGLTSLRSYGSLLYLRRSFSFLFPRAQMTTPKLGAVSKAPQQQKSRIKARIEQLVPAWLKVEYGIVAKK